MLGRARSLGSKDAQTSRPADAEPRRRQEGSATHATKGTEGEEEEQQKRGARLEKTTAARMWRAVDAVVT
jgi:hypothetical protein